MSTATRSFAAILATTLAMVLAGSAAAQQPPPESDVLGAREFHFACAPCHGSDGRGEGPVSDYLNTPPADLTQLSRRFNGEFPELLIRQLVDGRATGRAHGEADMPVWGDQFMFEEDREALPDRAEAAIRQRISAVVSYLKTIQEP